MKNQYGVLEKKIVLKVEDLDDGYGEEEKALEMKRELHGIFKKQMRIYSALARCSNQCGASNESSVLQAGHQGSGHLP